jgi:hypothetical protein
MVRTIESHMTRLTQRRGSYGGAYEDRGHQE